MWIFIEWRWYDVMRKMLGFVVGVLGVCGYRKGWCE